MVKMKARSKDRKDAPRKTSQVDTNKMKRDNSNRIKMKDTSSVKEKNITKSVVKNIPNVTGKNSITSVGQVKTKHFNSNDVKAVTIVSKMKEEKINVEAYVDDFEEYESDFEIDDDEEKGNENQVKKKVEETDGILDDEVMYGALQDETGDHLIYESEGNSHESPNVERRSKSITVERGTRQSKRNTRETSIFHEITSQDKCNQNEEEESNHNGQLSSILYEQSPTAGIEHLAGEKRGKNDPTPQDDSVNSGDTFALVSQLSKKNEQPCRSIDTSQSQLTDQFKSNNSISSVDIGESQESRLKRQATVNLYRSPGLPYESFIRMFGRANYHQKYTQTRQVNDYASQTETVVMKDKSHQHPTFTSANEYRPVFYKPIDVFTLLHFLHRSQRIVKVLLPDQSDDTEARRDSRVNTSSSGRSSVNSTFNSSSQWTSNSGRSFKRYLKIPNGSDKFCSSFYKLLPSLPNLRKYPIKSLSIHGQYLIAVQVSHSTDQSYLTVWPVKGTSKPEAILKVRSTVTCAIPSSYDETIFAGTVDGSIHMWSLTSFDSDVVSASRCASPLDGESLANGRGIFATPCFSTLCVPNLTVHKSSIIAINVLHSVNRATSSTRVKSEKICSIDENATIGLWIVEYSGKLSTSYTHQIGDGMAPGSSYKLVLESTSTVKDDECCLGDLSDQLKELVNNHQVSSDEQMRESEQDEVIKYNRARRNSYYRKIVRKDLITSMCCSVSDDSSHSPSLANDTSNVDVTSTSMKATVNSQASIFVGTSSGIMHQLAPFNESPINSYTCLTSDSAPFISLVSIDITRMQRWSDASSGEVDSSSASKLTDNCVIILTGYADGTLALFVENICTPLITWDASDAQTNTIVTAKWLESSSCTFAVLDECDSLLLWDLSVSLYSPLLKYQLSK